MAYGGTLTQFEGAGYYFNAGEATREAVNSWIRSSNEFDDVVDFDAAVRDPANPYQLLPDSDSGDHLHPSDAGYAAMARAMNPSSTVTCGCRAGTARRGRNESSR